MSGYTDIRVSSVLAGWVKPKKRNLRMTPRRKQVLKLVSLWPYISHRQLCAEMGVNSTSTMSEYLSVLHEGGWIDYATQARHRKAKLLTVKGWNELEQPPFCPCCQRAL